MLKACHLFNGLEVQALFRLISMGYSRDDALRALLASAWCLPEAIGFLLGRVAPSDAPALPQLEGCPVPSGSAEASATGVL